MLDEETGMVDIARFVNATKISTAIRMFTWMDKDRLAHYGEKPARLLDNGPTEPLLLNGDPRDEYQRKDVETLCQLGFLRPETVPKEGKFVTEIKLTDKGDRLVGALWARKKENSDTVGNWIWIVVAHSEVFIDQGATPPNLRALIGGEWNHGDRIVIDCIAREDAQVRHLPLAIAASDPAFIADSNQVAEDFKYADSEGETE